MRYPLRHQLSGKTYLKQAKYSGFTLIELIMVILILGVLAIYAAPAALDTGTFQSRGFHDETLNLLRAAQKTAVAQQRVVCVTVNATGVTFKMDTNAAANPACTAPATTVTTTIMPNAPRGGTGLSANLTSFNFIPNGSVTTVGGALLASAVTLTITNSTPIVIEADTGYVHD